METTPTVVGLAGEIPPTEVDRSFFEMVLRDDPRLNRALLDERTLTLNLRRLLSFAILGLAVHGLIVGGIAQKWELLAHGPVGWTTLAFPAAFILALVVCLPSFYFYTQLSGLDASFRLVTAQALRALAATSVLLLGFLPFFAAIALGAVVGLVEPKVVLGIGFVAPFVIGLAGVARLLRSFRELLAVVPLTHERRGNFLLRLVFCWGVLFATVAPVALYRLVTSFTQ